MINKKLHHAWIILTACVVICGVTVGITFNCAGLFVKPVCNELGFTRGQFYLYFSFTAITSIILTPIAGRVISKKNIRLLVTSANIIGALAFGLMGFYNNIILFYISGLIMGILNPFGHILPCMVVINNWFKKKNGLAVGITMASVGIFGAIFNPIVNALIMNYGWRSAYMISGIIIIALVAPLSSLVLRYSPSEMDIKAYGEKKGHITNFSKEDKTISEESITAEQSLRMPAFYLLVTSIFLIFLTSGLVQHMAPLFMDAGLNSTIAAKLVSVALLVMSGFNVVLGVINDRWGAKKGTVLVSLLTIVGMVLMMIVHYGIGVAIASSIILGMSFALPTVQTPILTSTLFGRKDFSKIYSYVTISMSLSQSISSPLIGFVFDKTGSYLVPLIMMIIEIILALTLILFAFKIRKSISLIKR